MSTRDTAAVGEPWAQVPRASDHAQLRWLQRTGRHDLTVETAWRHAVRVHVSYTHCEQTRCHETTGTLLLSDGEQIITVLYAREEDIETARRQRREDAVLEVRTDA